MNILSVIVPVKNAEKYISDCMLSILRQTFRDFEIIVIDDNSTDKSIMIAESLLKCSNIPYRIFKNNLSCGVSYSRNKGIELASGEYLTFIDADDMVEPYLFQYLVDGIDQYDFVYCLNDRLESLSKKDVAGGVLITDCTLSPKEYIVTRGKVWGSILRSDIIVAHEIRFEESVDFKEDHLFMAEYLLYVNTIGLIASKAYHYRITPGSLVQNFGNPVIAANKAITAFEKSVLKLCNRKEYYQRSIFVKVCRLFLNAAWGECYRAGFSNQIDFDLFMAAMDKFEMRYIIQSELSVSEKMKEFFLHLPIFKMKCTWKMILRCTREERS